MKLISLNIERDKHYGCWVPWVQAEAPDVLCLQEVFEDDLPMLAKQLGLLHTAFTPMTRHNPSPEGRVAVMGQAMLARSPLEQVQDVAYWGGGSGRDDFDTSTPEAKERVARYALLVAKVGEIQVVTTHLVWTPDGESSPSQRAACTAMLQALEAMGDVVLCGDFNAPRGKDVFARLAVEYRDNIPSHYICSLDKTLHRAGDKLAELMVDGLFTSPAYVATDVRLQAGVSDHMGIVATIERVM